MDLRYENRSGYTLIEVVTALAIFMVVAVPMVRYFGESSLSHGERNLLTALSLFEQESSLIRHDPSTMVQRKKRRVNGREWTVVTIARGDHLQKVTMKILLKNNVIYEMSFYVYKP